MELKSLPNLSLQCASYVNLERSAVTTVPVAPSEPPQPDHDHVSLGCVFGRWLPKALSRLSRGGREGRHCRDHARAICRGIAREPAVFNQKTL